MLQGTFFSYYLDINKSIMEQEELETRIRAKEIIEQRHFEYLVRLKDGIIRENFSFTPLECGFDVEFRSGNSYYIGEIKVRNDETDTFFKKYGAFLQENKYTGMTKAHDQILASANTDVKLLYLNFTRDSIEIYALPLNVRYKFFQWLLPKNSIEPKNKIMKWVTRIYNPIETIMLADIGITEDEYLWMNSIDE
jgi:hypothetical protein